MTEAPSSSSSSPNNSKRWLARTVQRAGRSLKTSLATVGAVTTAAGLYYYWYQAQISTDEQQKKQVLYIPFDRLTLVEQKDPKSQLFTNVAAQDTAQRPISMTVREVVEAIHTAAADPNIVALYGTFGSMPGAGWGDLEEVRNALRVFRESHRRHAEPNTAHEIQVIPRIESKPLYCYAPTLMTDPSNKEYYLASIFTHIHLQRNGELALFGLVSPQYFLRDVLRKYGIQLHVLKHGEYKNAPNMFTESFLTRPHRENVTELLQAINASQCEEITRSRSQALLTSWLHKSNNKRMDVWKKIQESGIFPAQTAWKTGLVDFLPSKDPLPDLLAWNNTTDGTKKEEIKAKWGHHETDFDRFTAEQTVSIQTYTATIQKKKQQAARKRQLDALIDKIEWLRPFVRRNEQYQPPDKIALLYANGGITDSRPLVHCIRQIKKDTAVKCIVLRVNSPGGSVTACESIRRELEGLPLVVSFGNVAASGGYYVAAHANRIFAQQKTITGSIGVFAIRPDLTQLAQQCKVNVEYVVSSELAATFSPFHPLTRKMQQEIVTLVDRMYGQFKEICSEGRHLPLSQIESLAKGRVWTGEQAKANGLVDELGGLSRALAYAERSFCSSTDVLVEEWPRPKAWYEPLLKGTEAKAEHNPAVWTTEGWMQRLLRHMGNGTSSSRMLMLTMDENTAIQCLLDEHDDSFPSLFWE